MTATLEKLVASFGSRIADFGLRLLKANARSPVDKIQNPKSRQGLCPRYPGKKRRDMEARSLEPKGIGAVLALDAEILASCFRLLASNENETHITLRITV